MKIDDYLTDEAVLTELGERLERTRLERNLTQRELAAAAGVERKAVQRIEAGEPAKLTSLVRLLRALGLLDGLDRLVPEPTPSPLELLKLHGKRRRRASGERLHRAPAREQTEPWRWGDESTPPSPGSETGPSSQDNETAPRPRGDEPTPPPQSDAPRQDAPRRGEPRAATP